MPGWSMLPVAVFVVFVGALLTSAVKALSSSGDGLLIRDAYMLGDIMVAIGVVVRCLLWFGGALLVGFYSGSLALVGLSPRRFGYRQALGILFACGVTHVAAAWS
ncbi:MAG: hypothetical protein R3C68_00240 [Myxococcota bacterium]